MVQEYLQKDARCKRRSAGEVASPLKRRTCGSALEIAEGQSAAAHASGHRAPRPQARQHLPQSRGRSRQDPGLRVGQAHARKSQPPQTGDACASMTPTDLGTVAGQ